MVGVCVLILNGGMDRRATALSHAAGCLSLHLFAWAVVLGQSSIFASL